jgi:hypothetical protein
LRNKKEVTRVRRDTSRQRTTAAATCIICRTTVPSVAVLPVSTTVTRKKTMLDPWRIVRVDVIMGAGDSRVVITTVGLRRLLSHRHKMTTTVVVAAAVAAEAVVVEVEVAEAGIKIIHRSNKAGTVGVAVIVAVAVDFEEVGDSLGEGVVVVEVPLHRSSGTMVEVLRLLRLNSGTTAEVLLHLSIGMTVGALLLSISGTTVGLAAVAAEAEAEITMNGNDPGTIVTLGDDRLARTL